MASLVIDNHNMDGTNLWLGYPVAAIAYACAGCGHTGTGSFISPNALTQAEYSQLIAMQL